MKLSFIIPTLAGIFIFALSGLGYFAWSYNHVAEVNLDNVRVCFGCHGEQGNIVFDETPVLAGKKREYLLSQLQMIQQGQREIPVMEGVLANYDRRQLLEAAHYYANLPTPEQTESELFCAGCHEATSNESIFPVPEPH